MNTLEKFRRLILKHHIDPNSNKDIEEISQDLKALEIIKPCCIVADYKTDDPDTRYELAFCKKICITQEEYDLLKEVLVC